MNKSITLSLAGIAALLTVTSAQLTGCGDDETTTTVASTTRSSSTTGNTGGTGATGGGGSGGQGGVLTGSDTCPGENYQMAAGDVLLLDGDTSASADDYQSYCGNVPAGSSGPDNVYLFVFTDAGTLDLQLTGSGTLDPVMYLRSTCTDDTTTFWCRNVGTMMMRRFAQPILPGAYYLLVDGAAQTSGAYTLRVDFGAPACGDGALNPNTTEECDDGNTAPGDGCTATCTLEPLVHEDCADPEPFNILAGTTVIQGTNLGNSDDITFSGSSPSCIANPDTGGSPDRVYELRAATSGMMTIRLGFDAMGTTPACTINPNGPYCFDRTLHVRNQSGQQGMAACANIANQIACDSGGTAPGYEQELTFAVTANEYYYVFVDSFWNGLMMANIVSGPYFLHIDLN